MKRGLIVILILILVMPLANAADCGFFCRLGNVLTGKAAITQSMPAMPDLIVEDVSILTGTAANVYYPNQVRIEGYVKNIGNANASRSYVEVDLTPPQLRLIDQGTPNVCYEALGNRLTSSPIPANDLIPGDTLGPGQRERFTTDFNPPESGTVNLVITADYENNIAESNENNNIFSKSFYVEKTIEKSKYKDCNAAQYAPCIDSDGENIYVKGTTNGLAADGVLVSRTDGCRLNNFYGDGYDYVIEWLCSDNLVVNSNEKCIYGCKDGACLPSDNVTMRNECQDVYAFACRDSCFSNEEQAKYSCPTGVCCKPKPSCLTLVDCNKKECNTIWVKDAASRLGKCEYLREISCSDNFDNDGDGLVDAGDYDCSAKPEVSTKYVLQRDVDYTDEDGVYKYVAGSAGLGADWIGEIVRENEGYSAVYKCKDGCELKAFVFEFDSASNSQQNLERSIKEEFCPYFNTCEKTYLSDALIYSFSNPKSTESVRIEYGAAWISYDKIILITAESCNLPHKACLTSIGMVSAYRGIFPSTLGEEGKTCPLIVAWRIEKDRCVSDAGCDYSPEKYKYYNSPEECNSQLEKCVPEWKCSMVPLECPLTGLQNKICDEVKCGLGKTVETISCSAGTCSGCLYDSTCVPFGYKMKIDTVPSYCSINKIFERQKELGEECQNDHECISDDCGSGKCVSTYNLLESILNFLKKIFGGK